MSELEYYPTDEIEDMELQDWEISGMSDCSVLEDLATIITINECEMDPHLDADKQRLLGEVERRGLSFDDDWEREEEG